ncbi:MAG: sigma-E factor negative regulatory protein, partial [Thioalkalispiraceae bacterium]
MGKQYEERLSALVDGEETHTDDVLSRIKQDDELRQRWQRYHLISDAMKGYLDGPSYPDISARVSQALDNEPTVLAPRHKSSRFQHWYKQAAGFAVAASVATVAVFTVQQNQFANNNQLQTAAIDGPVKTVKFAAANDDSQSRLDSAVESKLSGYLVQHNEYSVTAKMQGALPYMRIVSVTPGKRITKKSD